MTAVMLTVEEVAELEGLAEKSVYSRIDRKTLQAVKVPTGTRIGYEYRILLDELTDKARRKYYAAHKEDSELLLMEPEKQKPVINLEELTAKQRDQIYEWVKIIEAHKYFVSDKHKKKTKMTDAFCEMWNEEHERQITPRTLLRQIKKYKEFGVIGLADMRGQSHLSGVTVIPDVVWAAFQQLWLDEAKPAVSTVYRLVETACKMQMPEYLPLASEMAFRRQVKKIDYGMIQFFREGEKAFEDNCLPFLRRTYEDIDSNDVWSSDYHTLDLFVRDDITGKVFRPHAAVWIDVRSRKILSVVLCENSNSDGVVQAFRKAAEKYGIPIKVYLDNGREFLVHDFGGRGRRKTDEKADYGRNILERCGVEMYNATVRNAKTKIIERVFREVKNDFSKLVATFCGGKPEERPERLEKRMKKQENIPLLSEVRRQLELYIEGIYNEGESKAMGMRGKCPNEVYGENLIRKRTATKEQLNLLLLRSTRLQQVRRNGVYLKFGDTVLDYYNEELVTTYEREKVYIRYDTEHLGSVRIYDDNERFICEAALQQKGGYALGEDTNLEAIKQLNHQKKVRRQAVIEKMDDCMKKVQLPDKLEIMEWQALQNMEQAEREYKAAIIEPVEFMDNTYYEEPDEETVDIDLARMVANQMKRMQ